jgi:hypothetical protein
MITKVNRDVGYRNHLMKKNSNNITNTKVKENKSFL